MSAIEQQKANEISFAGPQEAVSEIFD